LCMREACLRLFVSRTPRPPAFRRGPLWQALIRAALASRCGGAGSSGVLPSAGRRDRRAPGSWLRISLEARAAVCGRRRRRGGVGVGVVEGGGKAGDPRAEMARTAASGFRAVVFSSIWTRGLRAPAPAELSLLRAATTAAAERKVRPILAVYQFSSQTPLVPSE